MTAAVPGREYLCTVSELHDGDTVVVSRRLKDDLLQTDLPIRLAGINAPELVVMVDGRRTLNPPGEASSLALMGMIADRALWSPNRTRTTYGIPGNYLMTPGYETSLVMRTDPTAAVETEKYGRALGVIVPLAAWSRCMSDAAFWAASLNKAMLDQGCAAVDGPVPPW